ncbi:uncharacterized protein TNCV_906241 [Trichonephila clavipes]|nr:uncharacterized protein TNCV_906241 [Trichonephila clavipes]
MSEITSLSLFFTYESDESQDQQKGTKLSDQQEGIWIGQNVKEATFFWSPKQEKNCSSSTVKVSDHGRHVMCSNPIPLKIRRVGERCALNLLRSQTSSRWCGVVVRRWGASSDGDRFNSCQVIYSQFGLAVHHNDHQARRRFVEWAQNEIAVVSDFHKRILFSDEAHFWLNGYVNKQNCHIWSEANPQVYVETQLHPEKLTVWCALWAGGILLQKR